MYSLIVYVEAQKLTNSNTTGRQKSNGRQFPSQLISSSVDLMRIVQLTGKDVAVWL